jgi:Protein of unknown function (DUF1552)
MNLNLNRPLSRRAVLKGLGATIALPFLEAMSPRSLFAGQATAAAKVAPRRMAVFYIPNGATMEHWTPTTVGSGFELPRILQPLAPFQKELLVLSGLADAKAMGNGDGPGDHARAMSSFLTASQPFKTAGENIRVGVSLDQLAAQQIGQGTALPSLELGLEYGRQAGSCDSGYACTYSNTLSWSSPTAPAPKIVNPQVAFDRLFGGKADAEDSGQKTLFRQSILDFVREDAGRLNRRLGHSDRGRMDEYLTSIRELEVRLQKPAPEIPAEIAGGLQRPAGIPQNFRDHYRLMADLLALAFQADVTRVSTLIFGVEGSRRIFPEIGVLEEHHGISHHKGDVEKIEKITQINTFHMEEFAYFLAKLKSIKEGGGTLLDNSMILYGGGCADGNRHSHFDLPVLIAGNGGGHFATGQHVAFEKNTPISNLYLNLLDGLGVEAESFGDSTGRLSGITT